MLQHRSLKRSWKGGLEGLGLGGLPEGEQHHHYVIPVTSGNREEATLEPPQNLMHGATCGNVLGGGLMDRDGCVVPPGSLEDGVAHSLRIDTCT